MNKTDRNYLESRVKEIVQCTNGTVASILNKLKKSEGLTNDEKFHMIVSGQASLKSESEIHNLESSYGRQHFKVLVDCFDYPLTDHQEACINHNKRIDSRIDEIMQEIELEGKRIIDRVVLGLLDNSDIPAELHRLGKMVSLANAQPEELKNAA